MIPTSQSMKPYKIAIFFSGLERSLKNSKYNLRQDECKAAAYALMGYAGMDYGTFADTRLRDVPYEVFEVIRIICQSYGADVRNITTANLHGQKKELSCGEKVIWKVMDSLCLKVESLLYTVMNVAVMN